jgi:uncharacterized protein with HEPN domain
MLAKPDRIRLQHMLDASREAIGYTEGRSRADLASDTMLARAVVKCIEIVGEAAARTTPDARSQTWSIPWAQLNGMRNRLIHAYFDINLDQVWGTVTKDLPVLAKELKAVLDADSSDTEREAQP